MADQLVTTVQKTFTAEIAHFLLHHGGKCRYLHGHSYRFEIAVTGRVLDTTCEYGTPGMVLDFGILSDAFKQSVGIFDHSLLVPFTQEEWRARALPLRQIPDLDTAFTTRVWCCGTDPTAEFLSRLTAYSVIDYLEQNFEPETLTSVSVTVYETASSCASYATRFETVDGEGFSHRVWEPWGTLGEQSYA